MHVLIIGGNHGLGLEWTKYYLAQGHQVTATYNNLNSSNELFSIGSPQLTIKPCNVNTHLDVTALETSVTDIDLIIYNAGTKGYNIGFTKPERNSVDEMHIAMGVNCYGVDFIIRAFFEKLQRAHCQFVYMSTGVSSTQDNASGNYHPYRISKAAGNSLVRNWDIRITEKWLEQGKPLADRPTLFALTPGLVDVGMGKGIKGAMPPTQAITMMAEVIQHVRHTKDSHALWSYKREKIEKYVIPTVIAEYEKSLAESPQRVLLNAYENLSLANDPIPATAGVTVTSVKKVSP
jgi:NAD(P)-dependent dehydrogenase (short-subunit alcohol dehydrogenase family)